MVGEARAVVETGAGSAAAVREAVVTRAAVWAGAATTVARAAVARRGGGGEGDELLAIREAPASADELAIPSQVEDAAGREALDVAGAGAGDAAQPPRVQPSTSSRRSLVEERSSTTILLLSVGGGALALLHLRGVAAHDPLLPLQIRSACVCTKCEPKARAHRFNDCCPICKSPICSVERGDHVGSAPTYVYRR